MEVNPLNLTHFAFAFILFFVTHGIADYWIQTDWQAANKSRNPAALWRHIATYTLAFVPVTLLLHHQLQLPIEKALWILPLIGLPHAALDNRKLITWFCHKTKGWRPDHKVEVRMTESELVRVASEVIAEEVGKAYYHRLYERHEKNVRYRKPEMAEGVDHYYLVIEETQTLCKWIPDGPQWHNDVSQGFWSGVRHWPVQLRDLSPWEIAVRFHVGIALDQKAHYLCLALLAAWLAS